MQMVFFKYGHKETDYLKSKDPVLAAAMEEIGLVRKETVSDLFVALVSQIISQQISTKGAITIWNRMRERLGSITPATIQQAEPSLIQQCGTSMRKAMYIKELAETVLSGAINLEELHGLPDDEVCARLSAIKGIGVWTAEMLMTFSMQRPDIMSWGDIAIHRGLRMLYRHRRITKQLFAKYKRRYSPYASVACLYLWAIADGECEGLTDPAPMSEAQKKAKARSKAASAKSSKKG